MFEKPIEVDDAMLAFPAGVVEGAWADARSRGDVASLAAQLGAAREGGGGKGGGACPPWI